MAIKTPENNMLNPEYTEILGFSALFNFYFNQLNVHSHLQKSAFIAHGHNECSRYFLYNIKAETVIKITKKYQFGCSGHMMGSSFFTKIHQKL